MAHKVNLEIGGVIENMAGFVTPSGERYALFGEGGGQALADELDVPLVGKVPLTMPLREQADNGLPLVARGPRRPRGPGDRPRRARPRRDVPARAADPADGDGRRRGGRRARRPAPRGHLPADGGLTVKVLYTAHATVTGGRDAGHGATSDGALDVQLRAPAELGGEGGGTNPEQLFAVGYAACFEGAIKTIARREKVDADAVSIDSSVSLGPAERPLVHGRRRPRRDAARVRRRPRRRARARRAPGVPLLERDAGQHRRDAHGERPARRGLTHRPSAAAVRRGVS